MSYKIHSSGACGIVDPGSVESWICDLCQNEKTAEASLVSRPCFFFSLYSHPHDHRTLIAYFVRDPSATAKKGQFIRQPTHFFGFASLQRARVGCTWRVQFSYPKYHSPTQSVCAWSRASVRSPLIAGPRYAVAASLLKLLIRKCLTQRCTLCNQVGGAVVRCSDCSAEYHISCAWSRGYKFGFEIQAVLLTIFLARRVITFVLADQIR